MEIRYHGHSCFELVDGEHHVFVDPFLKPNNPAAIKTADEVEATHVLVTHGHADHIADAIPLLEAGDVPSALAVLACAPVGYRGQLCRKRLVCRSCTHRTQLSARLAAAGPARDLL